MAPGYDSQEFLKFDADAFVDGYRADLAALPFDGDGVFLEGLLSNGRIDAKTLVDVQPSVPGEAGDGGEVLAAIAVTRNRLNSRTLQVRSFWPKRRRSSSTASSSFLGRRYLVCPIMS